jgi:hypothetical protein
MNVENLPEEFDLLPEYNSLTVPFDTIRQMCSNFREENGNRFMFGEVAQAFNYLKGKNIDFKFTSPDSILQTLNKYTLESQL